MLFLRALAAAAFAVTTVTASHDGTSTHSKVERALVPVIPGVVSLDPSIITGGSGALINLNVLANLLGPANCTAKGGVVGVALGVNVVNLLHVCACVQVGGVLPLGSAACPACPANASPACINAGCGCTCNAGYYAYTDPTTGKKACAPTKGCSSPSVLVQLNNGQGSCVCARGYVDNLLGGCINACLLV